MTKKEMLEKEQQTKEERDFTNDVKVNRYQLELNCENHASVYHYWADLLAKAKKTRDQEEVKLKSVLAQRELVIRAAAEKGGPAYVQYGKITEAMIKAFVALDTEVVAAQNDLINAESNVYDLEAAVKAMEHRKDELENLTKLWLGGYYSNPNGTGHSTGATDAFSREQRRQLNHK